MRTSLGEVADVIDAARVLYADEPATSELLDGYAQRLREPLRVAVAGIVKAGKSTLLNALIGERIAPTDAGECTRAITWYRHASTAHVTLHLRDGGTVSLPVRRVEGRLDLDLQGRSADDVAWIDVGWPSESLRSTILIDTPGIASLTRENSQRAMQFLVPENTPSAADAIVYLLRHVHSSDVRFLEAFRDTAAGTSQTVNAVAVLSRADEIGSGRIDSLVSAAAIADRYRRDGELRALALGVLPIAGLLAEGARTLRESEFIALREVARLDRRVREALLVSVDRFVRPTATTSLSIPVRENLLARFGLFGVRLAAALIRGGASTSSALADRLVQQSGMVALQEFFASHFRARAVPLKARGVLQGVEQLIRERPRPGADAVLGGIERIVARSHDLRELALLADLRTATVSLSPREVAEAERILGGEGTAVTARLGLRDTATPAERDARVDELLARWRALSESPVSDRYTAHLCRMIVRSVEGVASEAAAGRAARGASDVVLSGGPA
ncbi:dynamin family protein [Microbacterium sp. RD1]|uniref:dynamin family protein n=1 Tax=Microbacterium sp. RD1 TaxID=3457313 RepID=UPI003FA56E66